MLSRGSKIRITKSSAVKKQHPEVGSEGFLNSLYLVPTLRIGIGNAYFYKYGKEDPCRVERRPFCIDLGMSNTTQNTLQKRKTKVEALELLFGQENEIISLFPAFISTDNTLPFIAHATEPLPYKRHNMWLIGERDLNTMGIDAIKKAYASRDKKKNNGRPYLPIVDFELSTHVENIRSLSVHEFKSWFNALQGFVDPFLLALEPEVGLEQDVRDLVMRISRLLGFREVGGLFDRDRKDLKWELWTEGYPPEIKMEAAIKIRQLQSLNRVFMERSESDIICSLDNFQLNWGDLLRVVLGRAGDHDERRFSVEYKRYHPHAKIAGLTLRAYLVRSLLFNDIDYQVGKLAQTRAFRRENTTLLAANMRATKAFLRKEVPGSIAALDRLMKARGLLN